MPYLAALRVLAAATISLSPSPSASPSAPPEIAHVVTADRSDETLRNSVRTTYVVTAEEIARYGYRTIGDALANVPGVQIANYGTIGALVDYGIRGTSSAQTLVLIDGQPAPGGLANSVELGTLSTAGVQRIEVVEGGGSTLYGEGAIGGIINVITGAQHAAPALSLRYGSFDDTALRVQGDGFTFERVVANNTYALPPSTTGGFPNPTTRDNSDYEGTTARYGIDRALGALDVSFRASLESDGLGADGIFPYYSPTSRENDVNEDGVLTLALHRARSVASLAFDATRQQIAFDCNEAIDVNCYQSGLSLDDEVRTGVDLRDVIAGSNERTIYGVDLSRGTVRSDDGNGTLATGDITIYPMAQSAAYVQQTWIGARDEFYAGLRGERDGALGGEFSPSLGARFDISDAFTLKANIASAFRAPNASELYFPNYGNPHLIPERAKVGDVTLNDDRILDGASLGWFDNDTRELIVADPANNYLPENVDHAHIEGFTFQTQTHPMNGIRATLNATDLYLAQNLDAQTRLPDDAVLSVNLGLRYDAGPRAFLSEAGLGERLVGARGYVDPTQPLFYQPAAYGDLTAYTTFRITPALGLTLRGANLGNERYAEVSGYPMPGRTFALELTAK
ncbi:MAG TPA: TonB-dependent receptor [Candidatus Acidoferrales bacterium]|nr:TonB-dependent receptor [Candidatus Acidoferrales bacterium]